MKNIFSQYFCKAVMSLAAFFWAGCSDDPEIKGLQGAKVDVNKALSDVQLMDTTGLLGKTVSADGYCSIKRKMKYTKSSEEVDRIISQKKEAFRNSYAYVNLSKEEKSCFEGEDDIFTSSTYALYGVIPCMGPYVTIDEDLVEEILEWNEKYLDNIRDGLTKYNNMIDDCDQQ